VIYLAGSLRPPARTWVRALAGLAIVLVALSRVMLRAHWPSDVMGGVALGLALASAAALLARPPRPADA
jgi:membrane-associated phospholipid phosphatase